MPPYSPPSNHRKPTGAGCTQAPRLSSWRAHSATWSRTTGKASFLRAPAPSPHRMPAGARSPRGSRSGRSPRTSLQRSRRSRPRLDGQLVSTSTFNTISVTSSSTAAPPLDSHPEATGCTVAPSRARSSTLSPRPPAPPRTPGPHESAGRHRGAHPSPRASTRVARAPAEGISTSSPATSRLRSSTTSPGVERAPRRARAAVSPAGIGSPERRGHQEISHCADSNPAGPAERRDRADRQAESRSCPATRRALQFTPSTTGAEHPRTSVRPRD